MHLLLRHRGNRHLRDHDFTLFPRKLTNVSEDEIVLGELTGFSIGAGGDEGSAILLLQ